MWLVYTAAAGIFLAGLMVGYGSAERHRARRWHATVHAIEARVDDEAWLHEPTVKAIADIALAYQTLPLKTLLRMRLVCEDEDHKK